MFIVIGSGGEGGRRIDKIGESFSHLPGSDERMLPSVDSQSCVTRFVEDGRWYRAEIIKVSTGGCSLLYSILIRLLPPIEYRLKVKQMKY